MKYVTVSRIWVIDEIRNGKTIYMLDRKTFTVSKVNSAPVQDVIRVTETDEKDRYEFWYEEMEENEVNEDETV